MDDAFAHCEREVRAHDRDRYLAALFAPAEQRPWLHALYAFDIEVASIGRRVREPMAGELRLQWWREVVDGDRAEEAAAHPVAAALLRTLQAAALPRELPQALLDARSFDLYRDPMETAAQFEAYAGDTDGGVIALAACALGVREGVADAAREAGIAAAYAQALRRFPADTADGRLYLPGEVLEAHGAEAADVFAGRTTPALIAALADIARRAGGHYRAAAIEEVPRAARPAFLHAALAPLLLGKVGARGYDPFVTPLAVPQWRRQWRLWRAARG